MAGMLDLLSQLQVQQAPDPRTQNWGMESFSNALGGLAQQMEQDKERKRLAAEREHAKALETFKLQRELGKDALTANDPTLASQRYAEMLPAAEKLGIKMTPMVGGLRGLSNTEAATMPGNVEDLFSYDAQGNFRPAVQDYSNPQSQARMAGAFGYTPPKSEWKTGNAGDVMMQLDAQGNPTGKVVQVPGRPASQGQQGFTLDEGQVRYGPNGEVVATGPAKTYKPDSQREQDPVALEMRIQTFLNSKERQIRQKHTNAFTGQVDEAKVQAEMGAFESKLRSRIGAGDPLFDSGDSGTQVSSARAPGRGAYNTFKSAMFSNEGGGYRINHDTYNDGKSQTWAFGRSQFNLATNPGAWKPLVSAGIISASDFNALQNGRANQQVVARVNAALNSGAGRKAVDDLDERNVTMRWNAANRWLEKNNVAVSDPSVVAQVADIMNQFGTGVNLRGAVVNGQITPQSILTWRKRSGGAGAETRWQTINGAFANAPQGSTQNLTPGAKVAEDVLAGLKF